MSDCLFSRKLVTVMFHYYFNKRRNMVLSMLKDMLSLIKFVTPFVHEGMLYFAFLFRRKYCPLSLIKFLYVMHHEESKSLDLV